MPDKKYFQEFGHIKDYVVYRLINTDRNKKLLGVVPHISFLDLSIIFHCLKNEKECTESNMIRDIHFRQWGVPLDELYEAADKNTQRILGYEIKNMRDVMCEIIREHPERADYRKCMEGIENRISMYVLRNKGSTGGAACMLYPGLIKDFADVLGKNLYIIPSSVNELILLPYLNEEAGDGIKSLIKEINDSCLMPEDILSYSLYHYDRNIQQICIC